MKRLTWPFLAALAYAAAPSAAGLPPRLAYDAAAFGDPAPRFAAVLDDRELAGIVGTGAGLALDDRALAGIVVGSDKRGQNVSAAVAAQRDFDRSMVASSTSDPVDSWWALVGSELIAANLL